VSSLTIIIAFGCAGAALNGTVGPRVEMLDVGCGFGGLTGKKSYSRQDSLKSSILQLI
jgi:hypothetical protein